MKFDLTKIEARTAANLRSDKSGVQVSTPSDNWSYASLIKLGSANAERLAIELTFTLHSGSVGISLTSQSSNGTLCGEKIITSPIAQTMTLNASSASLDTICIRSADTGSATLTIHDISFWPQKEIDVSAHFQDLLPHLLREPGEAAKSVISEIAGVNSKEIGSLVAAQGPHDMPSISKVLGDSDIGSVVSSEVSAHTQLLSTYDHRKMRAGDGYGDAAYYTKFFRQSSVRVYHAITLLRELGIRGGRILEIGSLFGNFATSLQRLGYEVTAVDRYESYDDAMPGHIEYMNSLGVHVVRTTRENEEFVVKELGEFDAVICMAVIEHIPHTPRPFMKMLASHVKSGGALVIDTPNISHYWNRVRMSEGLSVHQDIKLQFNSHIPFEGHHREYTGDELIWMMGQVGIPNPVLKRFDYNILQFDKLFPDHAKALMEIAIDPTLADTILCGGLRNN
jgi:2-polyprenyl-3-methyl-5-hydroxy-6-metoxy-1,4-benzoquinol methylase